MTPAQEAKMDEIYAITLRTEGKFNLIDAQLKAHEKNHLKHEKFSIDILEDISSLKADKNKVVGAIWLTGSGFFAMVMAYIISFFTKH